jgi:hypothetical protein
MHQLVAKTKEVLVAVVVVTTEEAEEDETEEGEGKNACDQNSTKRLSVSDELLV